MKFSIIASIFALASVGMAAPTQDGAVKTLNKRGPCPEAGSGNIDPCCFDGGPDENCKSQSNCYERCGPSGPNDQGGVLGCIAGCASVCPSTPEC
ncbi:hypothetical protein DPSP01_006623 [Paraphaeosphaeria sporulosa]|uniref:Uncharacterized protein n=1 Tax=Paraphaeosphaeria sporulosa TaxID=1460663 RepID=A0A177CKA6_9PLEO|nr:uncharacterized protein CC84DRAFT_1258391 [Paraphaeosphaeria sporulosa]OAG07227.1 hypothetical protein CC84DRAFT_1258391 [Paraphaeosphaeria sporulosa]